MVAMEVMLSISIMPYSRGDFFLTRDVTEGETKSERVREWQESTEKQEHTGGTDADADLKVCDAQTLCFFKKKLILFFSSGLRPSKRGWCWHVGY